MDPLNEQPISSDHQADNPQLDVPVQPNPGYATMNGGIYPYPFQQNQEDTDQPQPFYPNYPGYQSYPGIIDPLQGSYINFYENQQSYPYQGYPQQPLTQSLQQPILQPISQPVSQLVSQPSDLPPGVSPVQVGQLNAQSQTPSPTEEQDYSHFINPARIAIYDDLRSAPRVVQVEGGPTHEFIERIASLTYQNAQEQGGMIPYTVIREVSENFIHASFKEVVISILDKGNTIRFTDQGPGIKHKDLVQKPGFTSATEPMKRYIRGVGSGFPLMHDYLTAQKGYYTIEDNTDGGAVITISLMPRKEIATDQNLIDEATSNLTPNEEALLRALLPHEVLGVTELHNKTGIAVSSVHNALSKLMDAGLIQQQGKKRVLTDIGYEIALTL